VGYELDSSPVADGEQRGGALALRPDNSCGPRDERAVIVIDGGFEGSGKNLV
jgi:hypothetical protein